MIDIRKKSGYKEGEEPWQWSRDCFIAVAKELTKLDILIPSRRQEWLLPFYDGFIDDILKDETKSTAEHAWRTAGLPSERWAIDRAISYAEPDKDFELTKEDT